MPCDTSSAEGHKLRPLDAHRAAAVLKLTRSPWYSQDACIEGGAELRSQQTELAAIVVGLAQLRVPSRACPPATCHGVLRVARRPDG